MSEGLSIVVAQLAGRLAGFLAMAFPSADGPANQSLAFLRAAASVVSPDPAMARWGPCLDRLISKLGLEREDIDLLLLAGMPEEHEGYAAVFRGLHPRGEPRPSLGLAAQLFGSGRHDFLRDLESRRVIRNGAIRVRDTAPLFERTLEPLESLWPALHGAEERVCRRDDRQ